MHNAVSSTRDPAVIAALVKAGADPNAREKWAKETPLHWAAKWSKSPAASIDALVKAGADLTAESEYGVMPLDHAVYRGNRAATAALVKAVSRAGLRKSFGITRLHEAAMAGEAAAVSSLLKAGADPNARYRQRRYPSSLGSFVQWWSRRHRCIAEDRCRSERAGQEGE